MTLFTRNCGKMPSFVQDMWTWFLCDPMYMTKCMIDKIFSNEIWLSDLTCVCCILLLTITVLLESSYAIWNLASEWLYGKRIRLHKSSLIWAKLRERRPNQAFMRLSNDMKFEVLKPSTQLGMSPNQELFRVIRYAQF